VRVFRRRSATAPTTGEQDGEPAYDIVDGPTPPGTERHGTTPGKGRPTPKRSEAERRRRQPYNAPADKKAASKQSRDRDRASRTRKMEAMRRGEDWALPRKDQGPVRALARDYVDSRRGISEYYMFAVLGLLVLLVLPGLRHAAVTDYLVVLLMAVLVVEGLHVGNRVVKLARQRYPGESTRGLKFYAAIRATQFRKLRMPAPRVKPGDRI
jgi:Protein of unknown function (DUF3043)